MNDSIFVVLLPFFFFFLLLVFFQQRGAWPKVPRYIILLGFAVVVPSTICLLLFLSTARKTARNIRVLDVNSWRVGPMYESADGMEGWQDALSLARGNGFRSVGTRRPRPGLPGLWTHDVCL